MLPKTIVLHYKKLTNRKQNILRQLNDYGFTDYTFYEDYDQDELTPELISNLYQSKIINPDKWVQKVALWGNKAVKTHPPQLNLAQISITIKFGKVFQKLSQEKFDHCIIFEDDIILCDNFTQHFHDCLNKTPLDWDAIYFGCCMNLRPKNMTPNQIAYPKEHPASRCCDSVLLKHKTIVDLSNTWFPFNLISDWELASQHHMHDHKIYWWEPPLTKQGTEVGLFKTSLK